MEIRNIQFLPHITTLGKRYDLVAEVDGKVRYSELSLQESKMVPEMTEDFLNSFVEEKLSFINEISSEKMASYNSSAVWDIYNKTNKLNDVINDPKMSKEEKKEKTEKISKKIGNRITGVSKASWKMRYGNYTKPKNESVNENIMTKAEKKKAEEIVLALKERKDDFVKRYGDKAEDVMYATATKLAVNEAWKKTGKTRKDLVTGKYLYEYGELKKGKFTGKTIFKDQYGKVPEPKAWVTGKIGEEFVSYEKDLSVSDVANVKSSNQLVNNAPFKHTVFIEPEMRTGVFFGFTFDENGNKIHRIFDNMTQVHEWAKSLNADVKDASLSVK